MELNWSCYLHLLFIFKIFLIYHTVNVSFLARDRERTVPMYITYPKMIVMKSCTKKNSRMPGHAPRTKLSLYVLSHFKYDLVIHWV